MSVSLPRDVFISYASEDKEAANAACKSLESEGIRCWIAPRNIAPGAKWERAIMDAINDSRLMVVLISEGANRSQHVEREVGSAFENGITVIPFRVSNTRPTGVLAYYLRSVQWIDAFTGSLEEHFEYLVRKVKDILPNDETESGPMKISRDRERRVIVSFDVCLGDHPDCPPGTRKMMVRLELGPWTKGLLGPSTNPSDQRGFHNERYALFGINHQPCTKASDVHFFVLTHGNFIFIDDVNKRIARLLDEPFCSSATSFLRIQSISEMTVKLQTVDFRAEWRPYPEKEFSVSVADNGTITFI